MSARTYNWLFVFWVMNALLRSIAGGSEAVVIGSLAIAVICGATADIIAALPKATSPGSKP